MICSFKYLTTSANSSSGVSQIILTVCILGVSIITAISLDLEVDYTGRVDNLFCGKSFEITVVLSDIEKINRITVPVDTDRFADVLIKVNHLI